ncbi:ribosome-binding factor A [Streptococcus pneumoniae]|nr:ribosome-binding factor A [Streptococcus pneumoniae]
MEEKGISYGKHFIAYSLGSQKSPVMGLINHSTLEIKREVNEILQKKVRDPRVQGVTITDVQMLGDLSVAKVYYTILSNLASDNQKVQIGLEKATGTIKRELGRNLKLYKIPDLTFVKDESIEYGNKIDEMLRNLDKN